MNRMLDIEKELLWIEGKYAEIVEGTRDDTEGYQCLMEDKNFNDGIDTIEDIERFIDDSYMKMLEQKNEDKEVEISILKKELSSAYEVQDQVLMDSYALPLKFVKEDNEEDVDANKYAECHTRLCYELYLEAYNRDLKYDKKGKSFGILRLNFHGLKMKNIKPLLVSTKHLFKKKKSTKMNKNNILNNYDTTKQLMLTENHF